MAKTQQLLVVLEGLVGVPALTGWPAPRLNHQPSLGPSRLDKPLHMPDGVPGIPRQSGVGGPGDPKRVHVL